MTTIRVPWPEDKALKSVKAWGQNVILHLHHYQDLKSTKFKGKYFTTYTQVSKAAPTDRALKIAVILDVLGQTGVTCIDLYRKHHSLPRNSIKFMISYEGAFGILCPFVLMWVTPILHLGFPIFTKSSLPILCSTAVQRFAVTAGLVVWQGVVVSIEAF